MATDLERTEACALVEDQHTRPADQAFLVLAADAPAVLRSADSTFLGLFSLDGVV